LEFYGQPDAVRLRSQIGWQRHADC
jgi:hypothetical protein